MAAATFDLKTQPQHGTWIEIRTDRMIQNLKELERLAGPRTNIMAVIKANAYGHGLKQIAQALDAKVRYLSVASVQDVLQLRDLNLITPLFLFGRVLHAELPLVMHDNITLSVSSFTEASDISDLSRSLSRLTKIHIKVDTGMGRMGMPCRGALQEIEKIAGLPNLFLEGIYTHFPTAEANDDFAARQLADFCLLIRALEKKGIRFDLRHAANSSGIVKLQEDLMNMVRPGIMLYGVYPDPSLRGMAGVSPVLSLKSRITFMKQLRAGESVGYGRTYVTDKPTRIAVLPLGYSHGYPWSASGKAQCLLHGKRFPLVGRISMDYVTIDIGHEHVEMGEEVTFIGEDGDESITAEEMARWAGTIPYEIITQLGAHLPRYYLP